MTFDPRECNFDTLLQNCAKRTSKLYASVAWHIGNFDEKDATITTRTIGHQTSHDTWAANHLLVLMR